MLLSTHAILSLESSASNTTTASVNQESAPKSTKHRTSAASTIGMVSMQSDWGSSSLPDKSNSARVATSSVLASRKQRSIFSNYQVATLKHEFIQNKFITQAQRRDLSQKLQMSENQVTN
ncbi:uncharacterized protein LOC142336596 [Convolutriloba macropyga]|uniref:uncharacterized protein LOC142336596 n=1 Tax=Convolutriloba macropyga TaxID=536237 RepID=UPI003F52133B